VTFSLGCCQRRCVGSERPSYCRLSPGYPGYTVYCQHSEVRAKAPLVQREKKIKTDLCFNHNLQHPADQEGSRRTRFCFPETSSSKLEHEPLTHTHARSTSWAIPAHRSSSSTTNMPTSYRTPGSPRSCAPTAPTTLRARTNSSSRAVVSCPRRRVDGARSSLRGTRMPGWHFAIRVARLGNQRVCGKSCLLHLMFLNGAFLGCLTTFRGSYLAALANASESRLTSDSTLLWLLPMFHCALVFPILPRLIDSLSLICCL
jgi:hypothetical protein